MTGCTFKQPASKLSQLSTATLKCELSTETESLLNNITTRQKNLKHLSSYLSELESQLSLIFAASPDIIVFIDSEQKIIKISDAARFILGYTKEELVGSSLWDFVAEEDIETTKQRLSALKDRKVLYFDTDTPFINHWKSKTGSYVKLVWRFSICDDREHQTIGVATDISHFGDGTFYNFKLLQKVVDSSTDGIVITDASRQNNPIVYANKSFERITGYKADELHGKDCRFIETEETKESRAVKTLCANVNTGKTTDVLLQCIRKNGELFYNHLVVSPVIEAEEIVNYISIVRDVTEQIGTDFDWSPNTEFGFYPISTMP